MLFRSICIAAIGFGNSNLFPALFTQAVLNFPKSKETLSTLMIMGQSGGALFPFFMGVVFDRMGLEASLSVLFIGVLYLTGYAIRAPKDSTPKACSSEECAEDGFT